MRRWGAFWMNMREPSPTVLRTSIEIINIAHGNQEHERNQHNKAGKVQCAGKGRGQGAPEHTLNGKDEQASTVKRGEWEQVHHGKVHRDDCGKRNKVDESQPTRGPHETHQSDRPRERFPSWC